MAGSGQSASATVLAGWRSFGAVWPVLACLLIAAASGWMSMRLVPENVDVSWLLVVCDRLLDGARLHVDIVEVNPPFSIWLYMPFALLGRLTGAPAELWLAIGLPALALLSVGLSVRILVRAGLVDRSAGWLAPAVLAVLLLLFAEDFGQREQFAVVALLPWLSLLAARDADRAFRAGTFPELLVAGLGAAVFVMIKPPMSVPALALPALLICFERRSLRPLFTTETLVGAAITFAYLAWIAAFHLAFFLDLMPVVREVYLPARMGIAAMLLGGPVVLFAVLAVAIIATARPAGIDRLAQLALLAALGYVPAFVLMGKGWTYQALPFLLLGLIAFLLQLRRLPGPGAMPLVSKAGVAIGVMALALLVQVGQPFAKAQRRVELERAAAAIGRVIERPTVATVATRLQPAHPLTRMVRGDYRARQSSLWIAENAYGLIIAAGNDTQKVERLERLREDFLNQAATDIEREKPDILFDAGTDGSAGQAAVRANAAIAGALRGYRVLYQDEVVTVLVRSDLAPVSARAVSESAPAAP
ncbi:MAG: hypothetical protein NTV73_00275 [Hyphomicrobiales bacterium]|nr:hypothetical protein [Hyphomicrobiales bacterium]